MRTTTDPAPGTQPIPTGDTQLLDDVSPHSETPRDATDAAHGAHDRTTPSEVMPGDDMPTTKDGSQRRAVLEQLRRTARRTGRDAAYLLSDFPIAVVAFSLALTYMTLGLGLIPLLGVGVLVIVGGSHIMRALTHAERKQLARLGMEAPTPRPVQPPANAEPLRRLVQPALDPQTWLDALWGFLSLVMSTITFSVALTLLVVAPTSLLWWSYGWALRMIPDSQDLPDLLGIHSYLGASLLYLTIGLAALVALPPVLRLLASLQAGMSHALLCSRAELQEQVDVAQQQAVAAETRTSQVRESEASALHRLERDIHDGPQQHLVRLGLDLGRVERLMTTDPERAQQVLAEARKRSTDTLEELRALSRGVAPPVLVDRGLHAALVELGATCLVPTTVESSLEDVHLPDHVARAAYFTAAEACANVAKHSGASSAVVRAGVFDGELHLEVRDDGRGGAHMTHGHGLDGLHGRVASAGGRFNVVSPMGGPTIVMVALPCA